MVALLSFRAEIAPGLDVLWDEERPPLLQIDLEDEEHERLCRAGAPEHWEYADVSIVAMIQFLFRGDAPAGKTRFDCRFSRPSRAHVRMEVMYNGRLVVDRTYPDGVCHAAIRLCGHAKAFGSLFEAVAGDEGRSFKDEIAALVGGPAPVAAKKPSAKRIGHEVGHVAQTESVRVPYVEPAVIRRKPSVPQGPLRPAQVRLYADILGKGESLPETLSERAKEQVLAYAAASGIRPSSMDQKTA